VEDGVTEALPLEPAELALCCASHAGSPDHVGAVADVLERIGVDEGQLRCGPHPPLDREEARALARSGGEVRPIHNNCSGKHAGMLALAVHHGWPTEGYTEQDHPVQRRIRRALGQWLDVDPDGLAWGVDGCGVPTPYLSLRQMARAFARLGRAAADGGWPGAGAGTDAGGDDHDRAGAAGSRPAARVVAAMTGHPERVSGSGRPVTRIMEATGGRLLAKEGAEGVFCLAGPSEGWGLALKVSDGGRRATTPAALEILDELGFLGEGEAEALGDLRRPVIRNTRDVAVGEMVPHMEGRAVVAAT
jgi:L-asparaginase II